MSDSTDRPRGMLTPNDRALLLGEVEYDHRQQYSNRRQDIRERIANGVLDFSLIQYTLQDRDRKRIFRDPAREADIGDVQFIESIRSMLYWVYLGLKEQNRDFEGLLGQAIREAEEEYARKYWGESADVAVKLNVDVNRAYDIDELIALIESGGPVPADRLYELLQLSRGVPIDISELDVLRVWFKSQYPEGEKKVLETIFAEYLGENVKIVDAESRVQLDDSDFRREQSGINEESAVIGKDQSRPDPSEIRNYNHSHDIGLGETDEDVYLPDSLRDDDSNDGEPILDAAVDDLIESDQEQLPKISEITLEDDVSVSPESVSKLLDRAQDTVISAQEVAGALGCSLDSARQALSELTAEDRIEHSSVKDTNQCHLDIWIV